MARTGITYIDVANAAQHLQGRGKNPTVDNIREILGTGSKSTIAQHLRTWKGEQSPDQAMLPQELLSLVSGLWEKLNAAADGRIDAIESETREKVTQLSKTANVLQQDLTMLSQQKMSLDEVLILKEREMNALSQCFADEKQQNQTLLLQQEAQARQLDEMKADNQRLHQLASHIQANLEHYQAAMQKLQIEQNLVVEKQQVFFQQQLSELDAEVKFHRQKAFDMEQALQVSASTMSALRQQFDAKEAAYLEGVQAAKIAAVNLARAEMQLEQQGVALETIQREYSEMQQQLQTQGMQFAVLQDQHGRIKELLQQKEDLIELLRQEKLFLIQENAEYKGYLKKMDVKKSGLVHAE